jgi:hypothetical protein
MTSRRFCRPNLTETASALCPRGPALPLIGVGLLVETGVAAWGAWHGWSRTPHEKRIDNPSAHSRDTNCF